MPKLDQGTQCGKSHGLSVVWAKWKYESKGSRYSSCVSCVGFPFLPRSPCGGRGIFFIWRNFVYDTNLYFVCGVAVVTLGIMGLDYLPRRWRKPLLLKDLGRAGGARLDVNPYTATTYDDSLLQIMYQRRFNSINWCRPKLLIYKDLWHSLKFLPWPSRCVLYN